MNAEAGYVIVAAERDTFGLTSYGVFSVRVIALYNTGQHQYNDRICLVVSLLNVIDGGISICLSIILGIDCKASYTWCEWGLCSCEEQMREYGRRRTLARRDVEHAIVVPTPRKARHGIILQRENDTSHYV